MEPNTASSPPVATPTSNGNGRAPATGGAGDYDAIIVGGGHNGLTTGAYLAKAGLRTLILERRHILGGACVTEELWPGARVSRCLLRRLDAAAEGRRRPRAEEHGYKAHPLDPAYAAIHARGPDHLPRRPGEDREVDRPLLAEGRGELREDGGADLHGRRLRAADDDPPAPGARLEGADGHRRHPQGGRPRRGHVPARRPEPGPDLHDVGRRLARQPLRERLPEGLDRLLRRRRRLGRPLLPRHRLQPPAPRARRARRQRRLLGPGRGRHGRDQRGDRRLRALPRRRDPDQRRGREHRLGRRPRPPASRSPTAPFCARRSSPPARTRRRRSSTSPAARTSRTTSARTWRPTGPAAPR